MITATIFIVGYIVGSILFGDILSRLKGVDIRKIGSGNVGATNVKRALGKKYGFLVFILDMLKGFLPVLASKYAYIDDWELILVSLAPVLGHIFPVFYKFRGGKGVATSFGVLLAISPTAALICFVIWITVLYLSKYVSLASMVAVFSSIIVLPILGYTLPYSLLGLCISILVIYAHRSNIKRLIEGVEHKVGR